MDAPYQGTFAGGSGMNTDATLQEMPKGREQPLIPIYIPPGKTSDMDKWNREDTFRWLACFLPPNRHDDVYIALKQIADFDGQVLKMIITKKPSHCTFGIQPREYALIIAHGEAVLKEHST
ncbi:hypothetical protein CAEBREN_00974 [Caenorhabditis brenneri]|uniref:Uncharacterized protein n=1 Tax=Caenorhabditis brenneri TaxID=135651 RepID=G0NRD8_CAEBE|nr:hypothetical protein CAEBREN_00974 [Caenorhabditis brenneri]